MRVGVDVMGSDSSPDELIEAAIHVAESALHAPDELVLFASEPLIETFSARASRLPIIFHPCKEWIAMWDHPLHTLRKKKKASLCIGIEHLAEGKLDAFVTAGHTGALIAKSKMTIPQLPGILRPALLANLPTAKGAAAILDVGGNVSCSAEHLVQFAHMGAAYLKQVGQIEKPTVAILNIGSESSRGTAEVREAYKMLEDEGRESDAFTFGGNIEGCDIFRHAADVIVTDGFTGNVLLKTTEGISSFIFDHFQGQTLSRIRKRFDYAEYPGAVLCGLERLVFKCHGNASRLSMASSIRGAISHLRPGHLSTP